MESISIIDLSQFDATNNLNGFYISDLKNHISTNKSLITKPHKHNSYLYILFTHGTGKHEIDFAVYEVKPGTCFVIAPGQTHHWTLSADSDGYIFMHTQDFYDLYFTHNRIRQFPFFQSVQNQPSVAFSPNQITEITRYLALMASEYHSNAAFRLARIMGLIDLVYTATSRIYLQKNTVEKVVPTAYYHKFRDFEDCVEQKFLSEKSAAFYSDKMHISAKHLNRIVKAISGKTTSDIILERTLLEAKRKIIHVNQSLTQISDELGFTDYAYFSRLFKSKTGQTPSDFQKTYQSL